LDLGSSKKREISKSKKIQAPNRGDDPFQVLKKIKNNAVHFLEEYGVSHNFNVSITSLCDLGLLSSWMNFLPERNDDINKDKERAC